VSRTLTVVRCRRGRQEQYVTSANYLWRISAVVQGLHRLLDLEDADARRAQAVHDLTVLELRVENMLRQAQREALDAALAPRQEEETTACDG
jgi:hypothetical protein